MELHRGRAALLAAACLICAMSGAPVWAQPSANGPGSTGSLFGYAGSSPSPGPLLQPRQAPPSTLLPRRFAPRPHAQLELNDSQREAITRIQHDARQRNQRLQGQIREQQGRLDQLYATDTPDPNKIGQVYDRMATLRRQMIQNDVAVHNEITALLNPEQRRLFNQNQAAGGAVYGGWGAVP